MSAETRYVVKVFPRCFVEAGNQGRRRTNRLSPIFRELRAINMA